MVGYLAFSRLGSKERQVCYLLRYKTAPPSAVDDLTPLRMMR